MSMRLVFIHNLEPGMWVGEDIYSPEDPSAVLVRKDTRLTRAMIQGLEQRGIRFAHIRERPPAKARAAALREAEGAPRPAHNLFVPEPKPILRPRLRREALHSIEDFFGSAERIGVDHIHDSAQVIRHLGTVVDELVDTLESDRSALVNIADLKSYDEYTYHHSLSVAVLSLAIGQHMGFARLPLRKLGMSAIMHDIGKTAVPLEVLNKPGKLTDDEFALMKSHSPAGFDYLKENDFDDEEILEGVLYHHEKVDGSGYPGRLEGEDIPLWSRIISVADVYDALTSARPYREPMQPGEAIEYIMGSVGSAFDYDVAKAFVEKVELYPIGRTVLLSDDRTAKVLRNDHPMRPLIRIDDESGEIIDLYRDRHALSIVITRLLPEETDEGAAS